MATSSYRINDPYRFAQRFETAAAALAAPLEENMQEDLLAQRFETAAAALAAPPEENMQEDLLAQRCTCLACTIFNFTAPIEKEQYHLAARTTYLEDDLAELAEAYCHSTRNDQNQFERLLHDQAECTDLLRQLEASCIGLRETQEGHSLGIANISRATHNHEHTLLTFQAEIASLRNAVQTQGASYAILRETQEGHSIGIANISRATNVHENTLLAFRAEIASLRNEVQTQGASLQSAYDRTAQLEEKIRVLQEAQSNTHAEVQQNHQASARNLTQNLDPIKQMLYALKRKCSKQASFLHTTQRNQQIRLSTQAKKYSEMVEQMQKDLGKLKAHIENLRVTPPSDLSLTTSETETGGCTAAAASETEASGCTAAAASPPRTATIAPTPQPRKKAAQASPQNREAPLAKQKKREKDDDDALLDQLIAQNQALAPAPPPSQPNRLEEQEKRDNFPIRQMLEDMLNTLRADGSPTFDKYHLFPFDNQTLMISHFKEQNTINLQLKQQLEETGSLDTALQYFYKQNKSFYFVYTSNDKVSPVEIFLTNIREIARTRPRLTTHPLDTPLFLRAELERLRQQGRAPAMQTKNR